LAEAALLIWRHAELAHERLFAIRKAIAIGRI
jgi:hypothetical protein